MSHQFLSLYALTIFVASIIPGPSMMLALTHGMQHGARRTLASAMGNLVVTLLQAAISIAGLGAILVASEGIFQMIKFAGAAYLIYLGIGLLRAPISVVVAPGDGSSDCPACLKRMFLQAAMVTAGNPKAIVFFSAVFPQFIDPRATYAHQYLSLMGIGAAIAFLCFMLYALAGQKIVRFLVGGRTGKTINRLMGGSFILAALGMALGKK